MIEQDDPDRLSASPVLLQYKVKRLEEHVVTLHEEIQVIRTERREDEERRLKAGVAALGSAVLFLGGVVWWMLPASAQDAWTVIRGGER